MRVIPFPRCPGRPTLANAAIERLIAEEDATRRQLEDGVTIYRYQAGGLHKLSLDADGAVLATPAR